MQPSEPEFNPYAAPIHSVQSVDSDAVALRKAHLTHETNLKSFGLLFGFGSALLMIVGLFALIGGIAAVRNAAAPPEMAYYIFGGAIFYLIFGGFQFWVAIGLRKLNKVGRIGGTILGSIGLLGIPIGTIISGFLLYLLWSPKGTMVFSDQYKQLMAATPEIKYKTSIIVWILLGIVLLFIAVGLIGISVG